jgi:hypothetical protein
VDHLRKLLKFCLSARDKNDLYAMAGEFQGDTGANTA